ncbi:hypothetical protein BDZ91DRAFT_620183, partial [Kalaharituber pfeilii]
SNAEKRKELSDIEKGRIIALFELNFSISQIARITNRPRETIRDFCKRYQERGTPKNLSRSGRSTKISEENGEAILTLILKDRKLKRQEVVEKTMPEINPRTLDRFLR